MPQDALENEALLAPNVRQTAVADRRTSELRFRGGTQWSELNLNLELPLPTNERAPVCRLLAAADYYYTFPFRFIQRRQPRRTI